jgi:hypothetical protein
MLCKALDYSGADYCLEQRRSSLGVPHDLGRNSRMYSRALYSLVASAILLFSNLATVEAEVPKDTWTAYAQDSVDAFFEIYTATQLPSKPDPTNEEFDFYAHMETTIAEARGIKRALAILAPYAKSTDSSIRVSCAALTASLLSLLGAYDNVTDLLEKESNKSIQERIGNMGTFSHQIIQGGQDTSDAWQSYVKMSTTVGNVLLEETIGDIQISQQGQSTRFRTMSCQHGYCSMF